MRGFVAPDGRLDFHASMSKPPSVPPRPSRVLPRPVPTGRRYDDLHPIDPDESDERTVVVASPGPAGALRSGGVELKASPASLWRRLLASGVDILLVGAVLALYLGIASAVAGSKTPPTELSGLDGLMSTLHRLERVLVPGVVLGVVIAVAYSVAFAILLQGRTPGRFLLGLRLVDQSGYQPTPLRAAARACLSVVSFLLFLGGFWLALFDRRGQTLHDKLTRTFVVRPG